MGRNRRASAYGLAIFSLVSLLTSLCFATPPLRVVDSNPDGLHLRLDTGDLEWETRELSDLGVTRYTPQLKGFVTGGAPMAPQVPAYGTWIVLPPGAMLEVDVVHETWVQLDGRALLRGPMPVVRTDPSTGEDLLTAEYVLPGGAPRNGRAAASPEELAATLSKTIDGPVLVIGEVVTWRGHRIAPVTVRPLQAGADGSARRLLRTGEWRIRFERKVGAASPSGKLERRDNRFASFFINGDMLKTLPREVSGGRVTDKSHSAQKALLAPEVRLPITRTGPVVIEAQQLVNLSLLNGSGIPEAHIRLYQRRYVPEQDPPYDEIEVPILMLGNGGDFTGSDAFVFYGLRVRDDGPFSRDGVDYDDSGDPHEIYNPSNVDPVNNGNMYYLAAADPEDGEPWARMESLTLPAAQGAPETSYRRVDYVEEDTHYGSYPLSHTADRNYWGSYDANGVEYGLDPVNPLIGGAGARVQVGAVGYAEGTRTFKISLKRDDIETVLGTVVCTNVGETFDSGNTLLNEDLVGSDLRFANNIYNTNLGYLDWYELTYDAAFQARDDVLEFNCGTGTGERSLEVTGFTSDEIHLIDVSDVRIPRSVALSGANLVEAGETTTLSLTVNQSASAASRYLAIAGNPVFTLPTFQYFKASRVTYPDDPADVIESPDVLVITHPSFRAEAERWAQYRREASPVPLTIHIADIHAVYDWYSGGLKNPEAIKRLCTIAMTEWGTWTLQIFGDANENVKGLNDPDNQRDWVPTHLHCWEAYDLNNEMLPSDKWFVNSSGGNDYPDDTPSPAEMLVGRFPANSAAQAANMVDKVITYEAATADWKKRAIIVADDAWSDGPDFTWLSYASSNELFEDTQEIAASNWETFALAGPTGFGDDGFEAVRIYLSEYLEPSSPPHDEDRRQDVFEDMTETDLLPVLLAEANQGAALIHYQGHANQYLLAHEQILEDIANSSYYRTDSANWDNAGRPWFFVGLGCHFTAWTRDGSDETAPQDVPSIGEKFLFRDGAGAVGTYGSGGFEYLSPNTVLVQKQFEQMLQYTPRGEITGEAQRSRWLIGEILLAGEGAFLAYNPTSNKYRRAVAQYTLLGDALMVIDAGPPRAEVRLDGDLLDDGADLAAVDAGNELLLTVRAFDEAGVDRLVVTGSDGADLSSQAVGGTIPDTTNDQRAAWDVTLPVEPRDYSVTFKVYDTASAGNHFALTVDLPMAVTLMYDGEIFVAGETVLPGEGDWVFTGNVVTAAFIEPDAVLGLTGRNVTLSSVAVARVDEHTMSLAFTARGAGSGMPSVVLSVDGFDTEILLDDEIVVTADGIECLLAFPNPVSSGTRFLFQTDAVDAPGRILIYTVAGHIAREIQVRASDYSGDGSVIVSWDGRDNQGDDLANGVYFYRVDLSTPSGSVSSDMQRLVMMH